MVDNNLTVTNSSISPQIDPDNVSFSSLVSQLPQEVTSRPGWQVLARAAARFDSEECLSAVKELPAFWYKIGVPVGPRSRVNRDKQPIDLAKSAMVNVIQQPCFSRRVPVLLLVHNFKAGTTFTRSCLFPNVLDRQMMSTCKSLGNDKSYNDTRLGGHEMLTSFSPVKGKYFSYFAGKLNYSRNGERRWRLRARSIVNMSLIVTVARDPIAAALSAYTQVSTTEDGMGTASSKTDFFGSKRYARPAYRNISCNTETSRRLRYNRFLDAIEAGEPLGTEAFHALPQASKINIISPSWRTDGRSRYDAIGHLEELPLFAEEIKTLTCGSPTLAPPSAPPTSRLHVPETNDVASTKRDSIGTFRQNTVATAPEAIRQRKCSFDISQDPALLLRLCRLYAVDYTCFEYSMPDVCRKNLQAQPKEA